MKSECSLAYGLMEEILRDLSSMYPSVETDFSVDAETLRRLTDEKGLGLYTLILPECAAYLHRSLDARHLVEDRPPLTGRISSSDPRPRLLRGLWSRVFDFDGTLKVDADSDAILGLRQVYLCFKKLNKDCDEHVVQQTVDEFARTDRQLPESWKDTWDCDDPKWVPRHGHPLWGATGLEYRGEDLFNSPSLPYTGLEFPWDQLRQLCGIFSTQLGPFDPYGSADDGNRGADGGYSASRRAFRPKHGPGAVYDRSREFVKYDLARWTRRLEVMFPYDWFASTSLSVPEYVKYEEFPSRLLAVPKTQKAPRLIAAEPTAHQWIQGGIESWLRSRLSRTFLQGSITLEDQSLSQAAALEASKTGTHATVDLSSASDRLSTRLVEYVFQANRPLLDALSASRTRCVEMPSGELMLLRKFATMGSACTFPVQTIVFALLSTWAVMLARGEGKVTSRTLRSYASQVRVFGDDIILPVDGYPVLRSLLATLGLKVNESKSFANGKFREACGMDAHDGVDVTPAYLRAFYSPAPALLASVVEASNNFFRKGFWRAAAYVESMIPDNERKLLAVTSIRGETLLSRSLGLVSFVGESVDHLTQRWNRDLHQWEARSISTIAKVRKTQGQGDGSLLQFFHEEPSQWLPYKSGQTTGSHVRKHVGWVRVDDTRRMHV